MTGFWTILCHAFFRLYFIYFAGMTFAQVEQEFIKDLQSIYAEAEIKNIFFLSVQHFKNWDKAHFLLHKPEAISPADAEQLQNILTALISGKPIQYILGKTEFFGLPFQVNPWVLIPRPETEELVQWILDSVKDKNLTILDIGTGSGCIPIALKHHLPQAELFALDISESALETAKTNALLNKVSVQFLHQDILQPAEDLFPVKLDVIVSNPPYVKMAEKELMHQNVLNHEPHSALFVPDNNAMVFYERIADFALQYLKPGGLLFFEINENLGQQSIDLLEVKLFKNIVLRKDFLGRDRMICCNL